MQIIWLKPEQFPILTNDAAHVWVANLQRSKTELEVLKSTLCMDEQKRADRFRFIEDTQTFIVARGILRLLLSKYLNIAPQKLLFEKNKYGKLFLAAQILEKKQSSTFPQIQFNLSHSHGLALFAFAMHQQIGVDIELIRPNVDFLEIADRFFSEQEYQDLLKLAANKQLPAFYNCWSRKEAFIKALGEGLYHNLKQFDVDIHDSCDASRLPIKLKNSKADCSETPDNNSWKLFNLRPAANYAAAVVTMKNRISTYNFSVVSQ